MTNGEKSVNPLRDEASLKRSGNKLKSLNQLRVDVAIVRREKAHVHIVNIRRNCLEFLV